MTEIFAVTLSLLWLLGLVTANTMGGLIHLLLVIAFVVLLTRLYQSQRLT